MTPRERVLAVLRGDPVDKVPFTIYEYKIPHCAVERRLRNDGLCIVNRGVPVYLAETPNCASETIHYTEKGRPRVRHILRTPDGDLTSVAEPASFTSWTLERSFRGPGNYKALRRYLSDCRFRANYDAYARAEAWMGEDIILRAGVGATPLHEIMIHWMGVETFAVEWAERRDEVLALEAILRSKRREVYPILAESPITHANYGGNEVPEVMGRERFREFCAPVYEECAAALHAGGKLLGSHLDGNNRLWADIVAASSLDYVEAFTPAPDTDMTLAQALAAWPDKILWINFPSSLHLASLDVIRRTAREFVELARQTNRVIIGITEDMPEERWQGNLLAISEVIDAG